MTRDYLVGVLRSTPDDERSASPRGLETAIAESPVEVSLRTFADLAGLQEYCADGSVDPLDCLVVCPPPDSNDDLGERLEPAVDAAAARGTPCLLAGPADRLPPDRVRAAYASGVTAVVPLAEDATAADDASGLGTLLATLVEDCGPHPRKEVDERGKDGRETVERETVDRETVDREADTPKVDARTAGASAGAAHLEAVASTTPNVILVIDADSTVRFANHAVEETFGYDPAEVVGAPLTTLMSEADAERHRRGIRRYLETGEQTLDWDYLELTGKHADGTDVALGVTFSEFTVDGERRFAGIIRDVTDRKERRQRLERADAMLDAVTDGVYLVDPEGRIRDANGAFLTLLGRPREAVVGHRVEVLLDDVGVAASADRHDARAGLDRDASAEGGAAAAGPGPSADPLVQTTVERGDGTTVPVEVNVQPFVFDEGVGRIGVVRDLSEQRRLERELSTILGRVTDAFFALDSDWQFTYVNERAEALLDRDREELLGASIWEAFAEAVDTAFEAEYERAMETQEPTTFEEYYPPLDIWFQVHAYPSETGLSVYFRDVSDRKRREERLRALNTVAQDLESARTPEEVGDRIARTAREVLDLPVSAVHLYDADRGTLEPAAFESAHDAVGSAAELFGGDHDVPWQAFAANEASVHADLAADRPETDTPLASVMVLPLGRHGVFVGGATEPDAFTDADETFARILVGNATSALDRVEREQTLKTQKTTLEARNEALERLQRINDVIRELTRTMLRVGDRDALLEAVCERLATVDGYALAWFGSYDPLAESIDAVTVAGESPSYLDPDAFPAGAGPTETGPAARATRTRELQVENDLFGDPPFEPWRQAAVERGYRSTVAIPVEYQNSLYGLVCLYATEPDAFTDRETPVLAELGAMIGYAVNALERKQALVSNRSAELEFHVEQADDPLAGFIAATDGEFAFENLVPGAAGEMTLYFSVRKTDPAAVLEHVDRVSGIADLVLLTERDEETLFRCTLTESTLFSSLLEHNAVPQSLTLSRTATGSGSIEGAFVIRIPPDADARTFVDLVSSYFASATLVARRELEQPVRTLAEFQMEFENALTDRQEEVLRTAYFAGFFEWPREHNASEVAEMVGISQPTFARHIRTGERTVFSMLFDPGSR